jgi:hypothetical protein
MVAYAVPVCEQISFAFPKAMQSSENSRWKGAMEEEMQSL